MNRYQGNTGNVTRIPDSESSGTYSNDTPQKTHSYQRGGKKRPNGFLSFLSPSSSTTTPDDSKELGPLNALGSGIGGILDKLRPENFETEDLLILMILYFLYRESDDSEFLIIMALMFIL